MHSTVSKSPEGRLVRVPFLKENCLTLHLTEKSSSYFEVGSSVISAVLHWASLNVPGSLLPQLMMLGQEIRESLSTERDRVCVGTYYINEGHDVLESF